METLRIEYKEIIYNLYTREVLCCGRNWVATRIRYTPLWRELAAS